VKRDRVQRSREAAERRASARYQLPDPKLRAYDHGLGTLSVAGEVVGHLASVVMEMQFPPRQPWIWYVIVWSDGTREFKFEDYGPGWWTARELDAGYFDHHGPSVHSEKRLFGIRLQAKTLGPPMKFDFAWLPKEVAAQKWKEIGLVDADF